ncbi:AraC family transcriptional regulator [Saccharomonospora iraqiensis]|uniref:AraC family transcriptional regulator n=1 Tax=Saccharomonospora iraqiensis TaxID=52698 RepID=UPI0005567387|nr:AraC family transcriptional regulator [Saccharomonospora iraqiensis]
MQVHIQAAAVREVDGLIDDLGGDARRLLAEFGVLPENLNSDNALIPASTAVRILRTAAKLLNCPDFGLRLAARQDMSMLGPVALAMSNSETVGEAMECAGRFLFVHNRTVRLSREPDPERHAGVSAVVYRLRHPDIPHEPQAVDAGLGVMHRNLIAMSGGYKLLGVYLPHPPLAKKSVYTDFFGAPVRFNCDDALLRIPAKVFDQSLAAPVNPELRRMVVEYMEQNYADPRQELATTVRSAVGRALGNIPVRIEVLADLFYMHPRTLQRRLAAEGTSFEAIVDDARKNTAYRLLTQTGMPLAQVASLVELAGSPSLTRAVRRWFGRTPTEVRRAAKGGQERRSESFPS